MFYTSANALGLYDVNANTSTQYNSYCIANATFCAAVDTLAEDLSKGNSNGVNLFTNTAGTEYLSTSSAGGAANVPEPRTILLLSSGLAGVCWLKKRGYLQT